MLPKRASAAVQSFPLDLVEEMSVGIDELELHEIVDQMMINQSGLIEASQKKR